MAYIPPGSQRQIKQEHDTDGTSRPHPQAQEQTQTDQHLNQTHEVSEENSMRQDQPRQHRLVKTNGTFRNVFLKISLEPAVGETRPRQLVFAKEEKKEGCRDAHTGDRPCRGGRSGFHFGLKFRSRSSL